jgi:hypothetical protein
MYMFYQSLNITSKSSDFHKFNQVQDAITFLYIPQVFCKEAVS